MSDRELSLLTCVIEHAKNAPLTRDAVAKCYYSTKPHDSVEKESTSEIWIKIIFDNLCEIDRQELLDAQHSRTKMGEILHRVMPG